MIRATVAVVVLTVVGLATVGCGGSDNQTAATASTSSAAGGPASTSGAASTNGAQPGNGIPTASRTTQIEAANGVAGTLEIGLGGLEVDGQLASLTLLFTPRYDQDPSDTISLFEMFGRNVAEVTLVDSVNLRRYLVVEDSRGVDLGPFPATVETRNNVPVSAVYTFAAPPAGVETVDVYVDDRRVFDDVVVTR
jgi:hypothetical protein